MYSAWKFLCSMHAIDNHALNMDIIKWTLINMYLSIIFIYLEHKDGIKPIVLYFKLFYILQKMIVTHCYLISFIKKKNYNLKFWSTVNMVIIKDYIIVSLRVAMVCHGTPKRIVCFHFLYPIWFNLIEKKQNDLLFYL